MIYPMPGENKANYLIMLLAEAAFMFNTLDLMNSNEKEEKYLALE